MNYLKAIVTVVAAIVGSIVAVTGPGDMNLGDLDFVSWIQIIAAILASGGLVYVVENIPGVAGGVAKAILAFLTAGFASLVAAAQDGVITQNELLVALGAAIAATGLVYQIKNIKSAT